MTTRPAVVFGDVHGESKLLEKLIRIIRDRFGTEVDIYSTGDLVDRGPDSAGVIDICIREGVQGILGNHELWLHKYFATGEFDPMALHNAMKGDMTLLSYGLTTRKPRQIARELADLVPQAHKDFILGLPVWRKFEVEGVTYRLIHGGLKKGDANAFLPDAERFWEDGGEAELAELGVTSRDDALCTVVAATQPAVMMWTSPNIRRKREQPNLWHFDEGVQIFGHIPIHEVRVTQKWIALDTGCGTCPPRKLSAVVLPSREIISVDELTGKVDSGPGFSDFTL